MQPRQANQHEPGRTRLNEATLGWPIGPVDLGIRRCYCGNSREKEGLGSQARAPPRVFWPSVPPDEPHLAPPSGLTPTMTHYGGFLFSLRQGCLIGQWATQPGERRPIAAPVVSENRVARDVITEKGVFCRVCGGDRDRYGRMAGGRAFAIARKVVWTPEVRGRRICLKEHANHILNRSCFLNSQPQLYTGPKNIRLR